MRYIAERLKITALVLVFILISVFAYSYSYKDIVITEVQWAGTAASTYDEWVELYNNTDQDIYLTGWILYEGGGLTQICELGGVIKARSFYLIERTDDNTVSDIAGDVVSSFGGSGLSNSGEHLVLKDNGDNVIDDVDCSGGWHGGTGSSDYYSMERRKLKGEGSDAGNWCTNDGITVNGLDADGNPLNATAKEFSSCIEGDDATTVDLSVVPTKIEITGGTPDTALVTVRLVDDNGVTDTTANSTVDMIIESGPLGVFVPDPVNCISGAGTTQVGGFVSLGTCIISCNPPAGITNVNIATLEVSEIDTKGPVVTGISPPERISVRRVDAASIGIRVNEPGGIAETGSVTLNWRIYTSTGALKYPSAPSQNLIYISGAAGGGDGYPVYGTSIVFGSFSVDFTSLGTLPIEIGDFIKVWVTGQDVKGFPFKTNGNADPEAVQNGEFATLLVTTMDFVISEVMFNSEYGLPDWIELYCKDDGNNGNGEYISNFEVVKQGTYYPEIVKTFKQGTFIRSGEFLVITEGNPDYDELSSGADNVIATFLTEIGLTTTDSAIILQDYVGNVYDVVIYAGDDSKEYQPPLENGELMTGASVEPILAYYDESIIYDVSRYKFDDFQVLFSSDTYMDPKLNMWHWYGEDTGCMAIKFWPNLAKYPDWPSGTEQPDIGDGWDWVYSITYAVDSGPVKEGYSISRDSNFTDTNTRDDWHVTDQPTFGRRDDEKEAAVKIMNLKIEPNPFLNDASDPTRYYTKISFDLTAEGIVTIYVFDVKGREVNRLANKKPVMMGKFSVTWIGNDRSHCPVPIGPYIVYIEVRNEYSTDVKKEIVVVAKKLK